MEARADVNGRHGILRGLTPLHEAASVEVAQALLDAGASPLSLDPREPNLPWYHEQRGRPAIASLIRSRRQQLVREHNAAHQRLHPGTSAGVSQTSQQTRPRVLPPPLSAAEFARAQAAWCVDGQTLLSATGHSDWDADGEPGANVDCECTVCMVDMCPGEKVLVLPCASADGEYRAGGGRPHAFHSSCMERWLLTKAGACPICRADLRRQLPPAVAPCSAAESSGQPASGSRTPRMAGTPAQPRGTPQGSPRTPSARAKSTTPQASPSASRRSSHTPRVPAASGSQRHPARRTSPATSPDPSTRFAARAVSPTPQGGPVRSLRQDTARQDTARQEPRRLLRKESVSSSAKKPFL